MPRAAAASCNMHVVDNNANHPKRSISSRQVESGASHTLVCESQSKAHLQHKNDSCNMHVNGWHTTNTGSLQSNTLYPARQAKHAP